MLYSHIAMPFTLAYSYGKTALHLTRDYTLRQYSRSNINSEVGEEEPLPLNDPFAGDASLAGMGSSNIAGRSQDDDNEMSLYNFKLVAIMTGEYVSYVSLINAAGEIVTLEMHEELSEGVKLVSLKPSEAVFQKPDETFLVINFKNQIKEVKELN